MFSSTTQSITGAFNVAARVKLRRGTSVQHQNFTGAEAEITVDTTNWSVRVHDGSTAGGHELLKASLENIENGAILDGGTYT
jgi:hypothetical protein